MRALRGLTVLLVLAATAACTTAPAPPPTQAAPTTTVAPGAITLPPRLRDIPIDDVDPCSLLPPETVERLAFAGGAPEFRTSNSTLLGSVRECTLFTYGTDADPTNLNLTVALASEMGIERFTAGDLLTDVSPSPIEGFPAVLAQAQRFTDICSVVLDVAPGQIISVDFIDGGGDQPPVPRDRLCEGAQQAAKEVMRNLPTVG